MNTLKNIKSLGAALAVMALLVAPNSWAETQVPEGMAIVPGGPFLMGIDKEVNRDTKKMSKRQQLKYAVSREAFHDEGPC
jgi:hypothetical protein